MIEIDWQNFDAALLDPHYATLRPHKALSKYNKGDIIGELSKCSSSFIYFCKNYVHILHPKRGIVPFDLRKYQERVYFQYEKNRFTIMRKPRQMGCSTLVAIYILWKCLFNESYETIILSIGSRESIEFLNRVYTAIEKLPKWMVGPLTEANKHSLKFDNGSRIQSLPSPKKGTARGFSCSMLVIDEAAFIENIEEIWTAAFPVISTGGSVVMLSTVNGVNGNGQFFYDTWCDAEEKNNDFFPIFLNFAENPEYTEEWAVSTKKNIGLKAWKQEYLCDFSGSIETFISAERLDLLLDQERKGTTTIKDPIMMMDNEMTWIWELPVPGEHYVMGVDVAKRGTGKSNSAFQIVKLSNLEQVVEFQGRRKDDKISTEDYAELCNKYGRMYNDAYMLPEVNNMGHTVVSRLFHDFCYPNLHYTKNMPGWDTNVKTRSDIINALSDNIEPGLVIIRSMRLLRELLSFAEDKDTGKVMKQKGSTDDQTMAMGIALCGVQLAWRSRPPDISSARVVDYNPTEEEILLKRRRLLKQENKTPYELEIKLKNKEITKEDISWLVDPE